MEFINHNDMAESLIKSKANIPEYPQSFSVQITHPEAQRLKRYIKYGDPEKYFVFNGHVYKWWVYYSPTPYIRVVPKKEEQDSGQLDLNLSSKQKINHLIKLANDLDEIGEFIKSDEIIEKLTNINL
jgi:hypothetical protein